LGVHRICVFYLKMKQNTYLDGINLNISLFHLFSYFKSCTFCWYSLLSVSSAEKKFKVEMKVINFIVQRLKYFSCNQLKLSFKDIIVILRLRTNCCFRSYCETRLGWLALRCLPEPILTVKMTLPVWHCAEVKGCIFSKFQDI